MLTFVVNIVMLNVLITIVGEGYGQAQANRAEVGRQTIAQIIVDYERSLLFPFCSRRVVRRGISVRLLQYPRILLQVAGLEYGDAKSEVLDFVVHVERMAHAEFHKQAEEETELAYLRRSVESMEHRLDKLTKLLADVSVAAVADTDPVRIPTNAATGSDSTKARVALKTTFSI